MRCVICDGTFKVSSSNGLCGYCRRAIRNANNSPVVRTKKELDELKKETRYEMNHIDTRMADLRSNE